MTTNRYLTQSRSLRRNLVAGLATTVLLFGGVGGWAATTNLASAVIAAGTLVVDGNVKKVQHPSGGVVSELLVREGQLVDAGQTLIRLDDTVIRATLDAVSTSLNSLHARQARLEAERDGLATVAAPTVLLSRVSPEIAEIAMRSERRLFEDRRVSREGQKARLAEQARQLEEQIKGLDVQQAAKAREIELIGKELDGQRRLFAQGLTSLNRVNSLDRDGTRLEGERGALVASIAATRGRVSEIELQVLQIDQTMRADVATELRDVENKKAELIEQEVSALEQLKHIEIKAPIAGAVHALSIHTIGGVITSAETLMEIVPQASQLTVEARIAPQDIDQLSIGQAATLRLTAFNRNTTPELEGVLIRISADLETDEHTGSSFYRAGVSISDDERLRLGDLALVPGMPAEAFIRTGDRNVLSYFTKPIRDHATRVFREE